MAAGWQPSFFNRPDQEHFPAQTFRQLHTAGVHQRFLRGADPGQPAAKQHSEILYA